MDLTGIKASTDEVIAQLPGLEGFVEGVRLKLTESVQQVVGGAMAGLADGIGQIVGIGQSIDGMTIDFEIEPISIPAIRAKLAVNMPLKNKGDQQ